MKTTEEKLVFNMNSSPEKVWNVISKVGGVDQWFGSLITSCKVENNKRFCETTDGVHLEEHILEVNNESKIFRFLIPEQDMLPIENLEEKMKVLSGTNGNAIVEWSATFNATDENAKIAKEALLNIWKMGLTEMETFINSKNN